jgi:soluble lytic murein transglycosylase-like protein
LRNRQHTSLLAGVFGIIAWAVAPPAQAGDIYIGTDDNGVLTFTDTPPSGEEGFGVFIKDLEGRPTKFATIDPALLRKNLDNYDEPILVSANKWKVPPELVKAMVLVESGMNPRAKSPAGARGLMQLMPATAAELGVEDSWDAKQNIEGGTRYLRKMLNTFRSRSLALAAYNAGPGNVRKYNGIPPFQETEYYVDKVLKYYAYFVAEKPLR